jgi:predicted O-methyltransferase YrrM
MNKLLQKSRKAMQDGGVPLFLKKLHGYFTVKAGLVMTRILRPTLIKEIKNFNADNVNEVLSFLQSSRSGAFIHPMQVPDELLGLCTIFKEKNPKTVLEIGTANGGTLFCFSKLAPRDAIIISIDLPDGAFGGGYPKNKIPLYRSFKKDNQEMFLLREDSHAEETVQKVRDILRGKQVDFLFIDGDHTYEGVKRDFELYSTLVGRGGIIAFHDIAVHPKNIGCFVNLFWDEIKGKCVHKEFIADKDQGWAGIGVLFLK